MTYNNNIAFLKFLQSLLFDLAYLQMPTTCHFWLIIYQSWMNKVLIQILLFTISNCWWWHLQTNHQELGLRLPGWKWRLTLNCWYSNEYLKPEMISPILMPYFLQSVIARKYLPHTPKHSSCLQRNIYTCCLYNSSNHTRWPAVFPTIYIGPLLTFPPVMVRDREKAWNEKFGLSQ